MKMLSPRSRWEKMEYGSITFLTPTRPSIGTRTDTIILRKNKFVQWCCTQCKKQVMAAKTVCSIMKLYTFFYVRQIRNISGYWCVRMLWVFLPVWANMEKWPAKRKPDQCLVLALQEIYTCVTPSGKRMLSGLTILTLSFVYLSFSLYLYL